MFLSYLLTVKACLVVIIMNKNIIMKTLQKKISFSPNYVLKYPSEF